MAARLRNVRLRELGKFFGHNFNAEALGMFPRTVSRWGHEYRRKYCNHKKAGMTPFYHIGGLAIFVNYLIDYKFNLKYEKLRKYH